MSAVTPATIHPDRKKTMTPKMFIKQLVKTPSHVPKRTLSDTRKCDNHQGGATEPFKSNRDSKLFKISISFVQCTERASSNPHIPPFWLKVNSFYLVLGKKLVFILRLPSVQILGWTLAAASATPTSFCPKRNHENRSLCRSKSLL